MDLIGIFLSQMGVSKEELLGMAKEAATTVQAVDARLQRMENMLGAIALHLGVDVETSAAQGQIENGDDT